MQYHPRFQDALGRFKVFRGKMCMGALGAPTVKPSWLYSSHGFAKEIRGQEYPEIKNAPHLTS
eukprot:14371855-Alexandrium_andersonii.AAC.1